MVARHSGFCSGVRRAVQLTEQAAVEGGLWFTLGPLVHNKAVVDYFRKKGIEPLNDINNIDNNNIGIVLRAHGVTPTIIKELQDKGCRVVDATCQLVSRIHEIVSNLSHEDYEIVIFGDKNHPEVEGILGWCDNAAHVISSIDEVNQLPLVKKRGLVSQTTKDEKEYYKLGQALIDRSKELRVFNTICNATKKRQEAARSLCEKVDLMLVIGDKHSSNTNTLAKECLDTGVKTIQISDASQIKPEWLSGITNIGITAGASTPDWIIKEVLDRMLEYEENSRQEALEEEKSSTQNKENNEESFAKMEAEMAEFITPARGDIIKGVVIQVQDDEVMVDVGGKSEGIIPLRELSAKDIDSAKDIIQTGEEIEVMVLKWDDDGTVLLSKKRVDVKKVMDSLEEAYKEGRIIEGKVENSVNGGLLVDIGVTAFLPASHVDYGYVKNLEQYVNQTLKFKIIEFNRNKRRGSQVVLSRKEVVAEEKEKLKKEFWENIAEDQTREGTVKRIVDYGAFIDLGGYEGLLHVSELSHHRVEHPADVLQEGDVIEVYILGIDREKERVSLSRKKLLKSPWEIVLEKYHEGDIIEGKVVRIAPFGAFIEIEPGVDGLVHISQLANYRVEKPEDVVKVGEIIKIKVLNIDAEEKKIGLSLKEVNNEQEQSDIQEYLQSQVRE